MYERKRYGDRCSYVRISPRCFDRSVSQFVAHLPGHISELQRVKAVELVSVTIPNSFYNISHANNLVTTNLGIYPSALSVGHYSTDDLKEQTLINIGDYETADFLDYQDELEEIAEEIHGDDMNLGDTVNVTKPFGSVTIKYDETEKQFYLIASVFNLIGVVTKSQGTDAENNPFIYYQSADEVFQQTSITLSGALVEMLGFSTEATVPTSNTTTVSVYDSSGALIDPSTLDPATITTVTNRNSSFTTLLPELDYPNEIYIRCPQLASSFITINKDGIGQNSEVFAVVPMTVPFGELMQYEPRYHIQEYYGGYKQLTRLDISLVDCHGRALTYVGQSWHMTLRVYYTFNY